MFPETGLTDDFSKYRTQRPTVTFAINRRVVSPVLFRNSDTEKAETQEFDGTLYAQVNTEKFLSPERLSGLHLLRYLTEKFDTLEEWDVSEIPDALISSEYFYNESEDLVQATNMDTLTYGDAGVGNETYSLKSHVQAGYVYSMDSYNIIDKETRNAVYESGTMVDSDGEQSSSLYELVPVKPDNNFMHFLTLEAGTPAMLLYTLSNILNTGSYGARTSRTAKNIQNEILAVITSPHPSTSLSSGELVMDYHEAGQDAKNSVEEYISDTREEHWNVYSDELAFEDYPDWYHELSSTARLGNGDEVVFDELQSFTQSAFETMVHTD